MRKNYRSDLEKVDYVGKRLQIYPSARALAASRVVSTPKAEDDGGNNNESATSPLLRELSPQPELLANGGGGDSTPPTAPMASDLSLVHSSLRNSFHVRALCA